MPQAHESRVSPRQLVALVCAAQVLVQLGAFFWPALLPGLLARWELTYGEAGWITAAFYAAYILAVPVLVTLTDRIDAKLIYLVGVMMTVFTTGLVLIPLIAAGQIPSSEIVHPRALVILGGLITATLLNLFVVPVLSRHFAKGGRRPSSGAGRPVSA